MALSVNDQLSALTPPQLAALSLLRAGLNPGNTAFTPNPDLFHPLSGDDWSLLRDFAAAQGFAAIAYEALNFLPQELLPERKLLISWGMSTQMQKDRYNYFCRHIGELEQFFEKEGMTPVFMKGLQAASLYPHPELREFGDLDMYLLRKDLPTHRQDLWANGQKGDEILRYAGLDVSFAEYSPKHSSFDFNNMHVENHRLLLNTYILKAAKPVENRLYRLLKPERLQLTETTSINAASPEFARIFLAFHALQHVGSRMRVRHIADWAMLCRAYGNTLPGEGYSEFLRRGAASLSAISDLLLDTDFSVAHDKKVTATILHVIFNPRRYECLRLDNNFNYVRTRSLQMYRINKIRRVIFPGETGFVSEYLTSLKGKIERVMRK